MRLNYFEYFYLAAASLILAKTSLLSINVAFHCMIVALFQQRQMVRILGWELTLFVKSIRLVPVLKR